MQFMTGELFAPGRMGAWAARKSAAQRANCAYVNGLRVQKSRFEVEPVEHGAIKQLCGKEKKYSAK